MRRISLEIICIRVNCNKCSIVGSSYRPLAEAIIIINLMLGQLVKARLPSSGSMADVLSKIACKLLIY